MPENGTKAPPRIWRCKGEFRGGRNRPLESDKNAGKRNGRIKKLIEKEIKIYG